MTRGAKVRIVAGPNAGRTGTLEQPVIPSRRSGDWIVTVDAPGPVPGTALVTGSYRVTDRIRAAVDALEVVA